MNTNKELIIILTTKCNMKCKYCYQLDDNNEHSNLSLDFETIERFIELNNDYENIRFYGGEPLVEYELIKKTMDKYKNKNFSIVTNGLLHDKLSDEYWKRFKSIKLSFDGFYDLNRINGSISQNKIIDSFYKISKKNDNKNIMMSMTLSDNIIDNDLLVELRNIKLIFDIDKFEIGINIFKNNDYEKLQYYFLSFCKQIINVYQEIKNNNDRILLLLRDHFTAKNKNSFNCNYLNGNYLVLDVDGTIGYCHVAKGLNVKLNKNDMNKITYACPLIKYVNKNMYNIINDNEKYIDLMQKMEEENIVNYEKRY